ncbi:hypothetical protein OH782_40045 [Streptomyces sp. NBC_01544]|uniref:hypothetical protein n=1 Tax=unclassified Streptomyces TaxID=2593676 RepID=UPI0038706F8C|nr:hypothetical protein OG987_01640 [Streptomyces sp. NBC_01620]
MVIDPCEMHEVAGVAKDGGDDGPAVLAEDADAEGSPAGHGTGQVAGADLGVFLAVGAVTDVVQEVLGARVTSDRPDAHLP